VRQVNPETPGVWLRFVEVDMSRWKFVATAFLQFRVVCAGAFPGFCKRQGRSPIGASIVGYFNGRLFSNGKATVRKEPETAKGWVAIPVAFALPQKPLGISLILVFENAQEVLIVVVHAHHVSDGKIAKCGFSEKAQDGFFWQISVFAQIADLFFLSETCGNHGREFRP